jgi:hypothetical protein
MYQEQILIVKPQAGNVVYGQTETDRRPRL